MVSNFMEKNIITISTHGFEKGDTIIIGGTKKTMWQRLLIFLRIKPKYEKYIVSNIKNNIYTIKKQ